MPNNETRTEEMIKVLKGLHQYVPCASREGVSFAGDQLTAVRARQAIITRTNSRGQSEALRGLSPCVADWHAKFNFMSVRLYARLLILCKGGRQMKYSVVSTIIIYTLALMSLPHR